MTGSGRVVMFLDRLRTFAFRIALVVALAAPALWGAVDDADWLPGPSRSWFVNWDKALDRAKDTGKPLYVLNTGSDWCFWCKKLHEEVLDKPQFLRYAREHLVLVYLDSPRGTVLPKEQKRHNQRVTRALRFGGGVPSAMVVAADGRKLGTIGGGGLGLDEYLRELQRLCHLPGEPVEGEDAEVLCSSGYASLASKISERQAALPPVKKEDFKVSLAGLAVLEGAGVAGADRATFGKTEVPLEVPSGHSLVFKVEYDIPEGYAARLVVQPLWPPNERQNYQQFWGDNSSPLCKGKGAHCTYLQFRGTAPISRMRSLVVRVLPVPEFDDDYPRGWTVGPISVDIGFSPLSSPQ